MLGLSNQTNAWQMVRMRFPMGKVTDEKGQEAARSLGDTSMYIYMVD